MISAQSATIFTDRTAWQAAVDALPGSNTTTDTFDNPIGSAQEITLDSGIVSTNSIPPDLPNSFNNNSVSAGQYSNASGGATGSQTITWTFPSAIRAFGADFSGLNANRLQINGDFDGTGPQPYILHNTIGGASGFFGVIGDADFISLFFSSPNGVDAFQMDNASFATGSVSPTTPEPSAITALVLLGGLGGGLLQRRQKKRD